MYSFLSAKRLAYPNGYAETFKSVLGLEFFYKQQWQSDTKPK